MSPLFEQMFGNLAAIVQRGRESRSGSGARKNIARQLIAAKKDIRGTPEYKAFHSECQKRVNELNYMNDLSNQREIYWEMNPDILTRNCRIVQVHTYSGGGGGD